MAKKKRKKIDWLNHSLEFFVVLIGILIAFQLNTCSDDRAKNELIENHIAQIRFECNENIDKLNRSLERLDVQIANCDTLLDGISKEVSPYAIRALAAKLLDLRTIELSKNAYNVLVQSGDIRYLKDYDIKRHTITLYEDFDKVTVVNRSNQNLYDTHFYPYLKSNFDMVNWGNVATDPEAGDAPYYSREFANIVSTYRYLLMARKRIYNDQKEAIEAYVAQ